MRRIIVIVVMLCTIKTQHRTKTAMTATLAVSDADDPPSSSKSFSMDDINDDEGGDDIAAAKSRDGNACRA